MSLTDLMSGMSLAVYPIIALILFLGAFTAILWRLFRRGSAAEFARHGALPLETDDSPSRTRHSEETRP